MRKVKLLFCIPLAFCILFSGCAKFVESALDKTAGVAGEKVGQRVGETVGTAMAGYAEASLRGLSPALMQMYVSSIFSAFFYSGGYHFDYYDYEPGEWSRWKATGMDEGDKFEKAFLKREDDGREWWRVSASGVREGETEEVILEALFSAPDEAGLRRLLRLRSLFPGDNEPAEIPVQEDTAAWYRDPVRITQESLEAATKSVETVATPAGTFTARHVVYRDIRGIAEWWLSDKVPGGLVKYQVTTSESKEEGEREQYTAELTAFGSNAQSRLQSF
ncbi:MAG: hypothetical protein ACE5JA_10605 [bacterium]